MDDTEEVYLDMEVSSSLRPDSHGISRSNTWYQQQRPAPRSPQLGGDRRSFDSHRPFTGSSEAQGAGQAAKNRINYTKVTPRIGQNVREPTDRPISWANNHPENQALRMHDPPSKRYEPPSQRHDPPPSPGRYDAQDMVRHDQPSFPGRHNHPAALPGRFDPHGQRRHDAPPPIPVGRGPLTSPPPASPSGRTAQIPPRPGRNPAPESYYFDPNQPSSMLPPKQDDNSDDDTYIDPTVTSPSRPPRPDPAKHEDLYIQPDQPHAYPPTQQLLGPGPSRRPTPPRGRNHPMPGNPTQPPARSVASEEMYDDPNEPQRQAPRPPVPLVSSNRPGSESSRGSSVNSRQSSSKSISGSDGSIPRSRGSGGSSSGEESFHNRQQPNRGYPQQQQQPQKLPAKPSQFSALRPPPKIKSTMPSLPTTTAHPRPNTSTAFADELASKLHRQGGPNLLPTSPKSQHSDRRSWEIQRPPPPSNHVPSHRHSGDVSVMMDMLRENCIDHHTRRGEEVTISSTSESPPTRPEEEPWYFDGDRQGAIDKLNSLKPQDGYFLIRKGSREVYCLTVYASSRFFHLEIRHRPQDNKYALGAEKTNERVFDTVEQLVKFHYGTPIVLKNNSGNVLLTTPF